MLVNTNATSISGLRLKCSISFWALEPEPEAKIAIRFFKMSCFFSKITFCTFKERVFDYFGTKEVTDNNVHAHIIINARFWAQNDISELWKEITGDDFIVDIRKIKNPSKAIKEVFKYIVKDFKKELTKQVSDFRKENSHFRWVFSSKGLSKKGDAEGMCEALCEADVLKSLEGEAEENFPSLDTIAISGRQGCPCCGSNLILVGDFDNKDQAEEEMRRILSGNQYRNPKRS